MKRSGLINEILSYIIILLLQNLFMCQRMCFLFVLGFRSVAQCWHNPRSI